MRFLVRVRVDVAVLGQFGLALQGGELDRGCIRGDTYCLRDDPAVGYSVWEAESREAFEERFGPWRRFYAEAEAMEVIAPGEAMKLLIPRISGPRRG